MALQIRKILVPVDFSPHGYRALEYGTELAALVGAEVEMLHVYDVPVWLLPPGSDPQPDFQRFAESIREQNEAGIEACIEKARRLDVSIDVQIREGRPADLICSRAKELPADLIVMGARGSSGLSSWLVGSVADRTLRMAPCPVVMVGAGGES